MRIGRVASATEPPNWIVSAISCSSWLDSESYLEVIRHVIIFASGSTKQVVVLAAFSLVRRRRLGVVGFVERVALRRSLVFGVCSHYDAGLWMRL